MVGFFVSGRVGHFGGGTIFRHTLTSKLQFEALSPTLFDRLTIDWTFFQFQTQDTYFVISAKITAPTKMIFHQQQNKLLSVELASTPGLNFGIALIRAQYGQALTLDSRASFWFDRSSV